MTYPWTGHFVREHENGTFTIETRHLASLANPRIHESAPLPPGNVRAFLLGVRPGADRQLEHYVKGRRRSGLTPRGRSALGI